MFTQDFPVFSMINFGMFIQDFPICLLKYRAWCRTTQTRHMYVQLSKHGMNTLIVLDSAKLWFIHSVTISVCVLHYEHEISLQGIHSSSMFN